MKPLSTRCWEVFFLDKERFLDEITDQISYKPLRPSIRQELSSHIEDRVEE